MDGDKMIMGTVRNVDSYCTLYNIITILTYHASFLCYPLEEVNLDEHLVEDKGGTSNHPNTDNNFDI
jgi:hypothetical protein